MERKTEDWKRMLNQMVGRIDWSWKGSKKEVIKNEQTKDNKKR